MADEGKRGRKGRKGAQEPVAEPTTAGILAARQPEFDPGTGLSADAYRAVAEKLGPVLADSYVVFIKTQGVHWNVAGPNFFGIHEMTERQYEDLYEAIDEIAERIRALGHKAPASHRTYGELGRVRDEDHPADQGEMVGMLIRDNGLLCQTLREAIEAAESHDDVVTADLLTARLAQHEQNAWMLRMLLA